MNYRKHYDLLMEKAKSRQIKDKNLYLEKHHIVPKSEGGEDSESNLVLLYPREHFLAHWLLYREDPTISRSFAFNMMSCDRRGTYKPSSRAYEEGRLAMSKAQTENRKGRKMVRHLITNKAKYVWPEELDYYLERGWVLGNKGFGTISGKIWINNGKEEKYSDLVIEGWKKGRLKSSTKNRICISKGDEVRYVRELEYPEYEKLGWTTGNSKHNKPWKSLEGKLIKCPHCGKIGGYQGMKSNHFDFCKKNLI